MNQGKQITEIIEVKDIELVDPREIAVREQMLQIGQAFGELARSLAGLGEVVGRFLDQYPSSQETTKKE